MRSLLLTFVGGWVFAGWAVAPSAIDVPLTPASAMKPGTPWRSRYLGQTSKP